MFMGNLQFMFFGLIAGVAILVILGDLVHHSYTAPGVAGIHITFLVALGVFIVGILACYVVGPGTQL